MSNKLKRKKLTLTIVGDVSVGKTSIWGGFCNIEFNEMVFATIGIEAGETKIEIEDGRKQKLIICDTSAQERYHSIALGACKNVDGIFICFDLTRKYTFYNIIRWVEEINENCYDPQIVLLGNKCDMIDNREITEEEIINFSKKHSLPYFEISVKNQTNLKEALLFLVNMIYKNRKDSSIEEIKKDTSVCKNNKDSNDKNFRLNKLLKFYFY